MPTRTRPSPDAPRRTRSSTRATSGMWLLASVCAIAAGLSLAPSAAATDSPEGATLVPSVVGGGDSNNRGYMVAVLDAGNDNVYQAQYCAGTLVRADVVLTAARCVDEGLSSSEVDVAVGAKDLRKVESHERVPVASIEIHPGWSSSTGGVDIALLRLAGSTQIAPAPLESNIQNPAKDSSVVLVGWGATSEDGGDYDFPDILQLADVKVISSTSSAPASCPATDLADDFCYGTLEATACALDTGGPLIGTTASGGAVIEGIVSWGHQSGDCPDPNYWDVAQRVSPYLPWIQQNVGSWPVARTFVGCNRTAAPFGDIAQSFARADIACVTGLGIANGTTPTTFSPGGTVTREQMAAFLARTIRALNITCPAGGAPFSDISQSFARSDIACVSGLGIAKGTTPTTFSPGGTVTREQMAAFLARTVRLQQAGCPSAGAPFADVSQSFARADIACVSGLGIANGTTPTTFTPGGTVTREQMAAFLARTVSPRG